MNKTKVSACIVTYNSKNIIGRTITSLLEKTQGVELSLYVVDNGSSDGTAGYIRESFPDVTVIEAENKGFGAGHNKVLPLLSSEYHAVINPDIILTEDTLAVLSDYMDAHKNVGLASPKILNEDGSEQLLGKRVPKFRYLAAHWLYKSGDTPGKLMREYCMLEQGDKPFPIENATGCFMFFRTSEFKKLGGFDERFFMYLEDCDIARRVSKSSAAIFCPQTSVCHLWERESKKNKRLLLIHIESILKYHLKWLFK